MSAIVANLHPEGGPSPITSI